VAITTYEDVVDLDRYPIQDLEAAAGAALVADCRRQLASTGAACLPGFLLPTAVDAMVAVAESLRPRAWPSNQAHTVTFEPLDPTVDAEHPRGRQVRSAKKGIAYDLLPADAPTRRLYESEPLTAFVAAALGAGVLYRSADPLDALQITFFEPGDELGWHFDNSQFSVTLMYQPAQEGGDFEYHRGLRSDADPGHDRVRRVLDGDQTGMKVLAAPPGALALFEGRHALHRVTPVAGALPRINSVLTYGTAPDMRLTDLTSQLFYGRTSARPS
jgi:alkylated DNA repair dioxygenase AlkB